MYADLPYKKYEQLIEVIEKMRSSRKKSFAKKVRHLNPNCLIQNELRKKLLEIKPNNMKPIEDNVTGIDYIFGITRIDQKFSFGDLGENAIIIRTRKRRLLNASDWTLIINKNQKIELFQTKKLSDFVKKNWGLVQKNFVEKTKNYEKYKIQLDEFYKKENIIPITTDLLENNLHSTLKLIDTERINFEKKTTLLHNNHFYQ